MKNPFAFILLACIVSFASFAKSVQPVVLPKKKFLIPVAFALDKASTQFYLPNSCSGLLNDYIEGKGNLSVWVEGKIQNGQAVVQMKIDYNGMAQSSISANRYNVSGSIHASETRAIVAHPIDVFIKGNFKLTGAHKTDTLSLINCGYITIYPDGSIVPHILDPENDPNYCMPIIDCSHPVRE